MDGDHAGHEVVIFDTIESRLFHHAGERVLVGVHADRLGEVAIARLVVRDGLAQTVLIALGICTTAGLVPSYWAARLLPADGVRYE